MLQKGSFGTGNKLDVYKSKRMGEVTTKKKKLKTAHKVSFMLIQSVDKATGWLVVCFSDVFFISVHCTSLCLQYKCFPHVLSTWARSSLRSISSHALRCLSLHTHLVLLFCWPLTKARRSLVVFFWVPHEFMKQIKAKSPTSNAASCDWLGHVLHCVFSELS